ncbi:MAG: 6-bladed beta-propeller [Muribaculaceae bacterium]|nr:6-bladed beta-propeller [Muribaculaceae bacterium]
MRRIMPVTLLLMAACGCTRHPQADQEDGEVLKVSYAKKAPSYKKFFSGIEPIALETSDSSLMSEISKAICVGDTMILYEYKRYLVFMFNDKGEFISRIGKRGEGPEEYNMVYDISLNPEKGFLTMLSPFGETIEYTLDNRFMGRNRLTLDKPNYFGCEWIDGERLALWSQVEEDEPGISVIDTGAGKSVFDAWFHERITDGLQSSPFNIYEDRLYFTPPIDMTVYKMEGDSLKAAYTWDFGGDNIDGHTYVKSIEGMESPEITQKITRDLEDGSLPYVFSQNWQTPRYYMACMWSDKDGERAYHTAIYDKVDRQGERFRNFSEGLSFRPVFVCNDYALCEIPSDEIATLSRITGREIPHNDDDNIVLARFRFKH